MNAALCPTAAPGHQKPSGIVRGELLAAEWNMLVFSAGLLPAALCEHVRKAGRKALAVSAVDATVLENSHGNEKPFTG